MTSDKMVAGDLLASNQRRLLLDASSKYAGRTISRRGRKGAARNTLLSLRMPPGCASCLGRRSQEDKKWEIEQPC